MKSRGLPNLIRCSPQPMLENLIGMSTHSRDNKNDTDTPRLNQQVIDHAFQLFGLTPPIDRASVDFKYRELLRTWHPHRYANLTNNPRKYMQMYKKGETMSKEIESAYQILLYWIKQQESVGTQQAGNV